MIIDFHTHIFPDNLAVRSIPLLSKAAGIKNNTDGTINGTLENMKKHNVDISVVCNIATNSKQTENVNKFAIEADMHPELISFGSVHPECDYIYFLDMLKENGIKGIKLHPEYQQFYIDEPRMSKIYEEILKRDFVLLFHTGHDDGFKDVPVHASPDRIKNVIDMFRGEKVVLAHLGGYKLWDEFYEKLIGEDVYIDNSCSVGFMPDETINKIIIGHGTDKVLFASDTPWTRVDEDIEFIKNMDISEQDKENIFSGNAKKLLGI